MQIDFGEKCALLAGELVPVFLLVAVLDYSRRLFVKGFVNQRSDDPRVGRGPPCVRARRKTPAR